MKSVYILLTRSHTLLSHSVSWLTGDEWTHVSLALDSRLKHMYSFARKNPHFPLPAGFVREDPRAGYFGAHGHIPCMLLRLRVEDEVYGDICRRLERMRAQADQLRYSLLGLMLCRLDFAHRRETHFFCSQFVGRLLEETGALRLPKDASLMRPNDYAQMDGLEIVFMGSLCDCAQTSEEYGRWLDGGGFCGEYESQPV